MAEQDKTATVLGAAKSASTGGGGVGAAAPDVQGMPDPDPGLVAATEIATKGIETDKAGKPSAEDEVRIADATGWLLAAYDAPEEVTSVIELNVGTPKKPVWLPWTVKSIDGMLIRRIRARAADSIGDSSRRQASAATNVEAAFRTNLEVIVEGTVDPDLREAAAARNIADATLIVEGALRNKQGLVDQVAGAIYALSGYDEEDVRDQVEQAAARSS